MASFHKRNRIVVFRLTQEEYDSLKSACVAAGSRNISDFTRTELLAAVQGDGQGGALGRKVVEIDRKLDNLHTMIERVSERIASPEVVLARAQNGSGRE